MTKFIPLAIVAFVSTSFAQGGLTFSEYLNQAQTPVPDTAKAESPNKKPVAPAAPEKANAGDCTDAIARLPETKPNFKFETFPKDLITSVVKVQASCKIKFTCPKDEKMTDVGLTAGCVKQLPKEPAQIMSMLKTVAVPMGQSLIAKELGVDKSEVPSNIKDIPAFAKEQAAKKGLADPPQKVQSFIKFIGVLEGEKTDDIATGEAPPPPTFPFYEAFLDSIEAYANAILPEREKVEAQKVNINAETTSPKDEFEKQIDYEARLAEFEKGKQQKILALEQDYQNVTKEIMDKLKVGITFKNDIPPNWEGLLQKNGDIEEYKERIKKITNKISVATVKNEQIIGLFIKLNFNQKEQEMLAKHWFEKMQIYISRLEKARELMKDYIIREQAQILTTERQKHQMSLGAYNADNEEFEFSMSDANSKTVPFDFSGMVKISPEQARETNRKTDDFTASVDYINYPLIVNGAMLYPGVKKANVFYKEQELKAIGKFKLIPGLDKNAGFTEWVTYADSLLTGKLAPRNLDSVYVMSTSATKSMKMKGSKESSGESGDTFWTNRNIFRTAMFGLCATSFVLAVWQNSEVDSKNTKMNEMYAKAAYSPSEETYAAFQKSVDDIKASEDLRTGFFIGAGAFGAAGIISFFF